MKRLRTVSRHALAVAALLIWTLGAGLYMAAHDTMTTDEGVHVASAYLALTRHDFRFDSEHPFLFKVLTAVPLLPLNLNLPSDDAKFWEGAVPSYYDSWRESRGWSDEWFFKSGNDATKMIFLARIPAVLVLALTVWLAYWVGRQWFGRKVALWAMLLTAFNPLLLGHGHLANTDIPLVPTFLLALYAIWRYGEAPSLRRALWLALATLAAMLSKFSGAILIPIFLVYLLVITVQRRVSLRQAIGHGLAFLALIYALLWAAYLGASHYYPGAPYLPATLDHVRQILEGRGYTLDKFSNLAARFVPMEYLKALFFQLDNSGVGRPSYLLGHDLSSGVWYYFPVLYLLKTPLLEILLLAGGAWTVIRQKGRHSSHLVLGLAILIYGVVALGNKLNIGLRHILPLFPLFSLYMALAVPAVLSWARRRWLVTPLLLAGIVLPVLAWFPTMINYSNVLVQPSAQAWRYYNDSNLDWGQDMREVSAAVHDLFPGQMVFYNPKWSPYSLAYYGVESRPFDPRNPPHDGVAVIAATELTYPEYAGFRDKAPAASISNTTFVFVLR